VSPLAKIEPVFLLKPSEAPFEWNRDQIYSRGRVTTCCAIGEVSVASDDRSWLVLNNGYHQQIGRHTTDLPYFRYFITIIH
jgi:hypothetical protein